MAILELAGKTRYISIETEGYPNYSLYYFYEEMSKGDIVFSLGDQKHIDAIGMIIGEPELLEEEDYPRSMKVKWFAINIHERIYELNGHKNLPKTQFIHYLVFHYQA